ncbi:MAG: radical SAM protein [Candidatus Omnitrophota bacterium]|nr:radical SAM protein [Candidatus Omnitrophota bacterium]
MKIVLANLPWNSFGKVGVRAGSRWPHLKGRTEKHYLPFPFFLAYTAALLKENDFDVKLIDAIAEKRSYKGFLGDIKKLKPRILICETSTVTLEHDIKFLEKIKKEVSGIFFVICGPDINIRQPAFLEKYRFIDAVLAGEYEFTVLDLVRCIRENKELNNTPGIIYRDSNNVKVNPFRPLINLDKLPWPLRKGLPMGMYNDTPGDMPIPSAQMLASRGCPYRCKFCLWPQVMYQSNSYRARDIIDVVDEMEYLIKEMHFKSIYFDDDTFNVGKGRMLKLCDEIKKRKLDIPWAIMARADLMDREILEKMRETGLFAVKYGVESASQELLDNINKNMDIKKTEEIIRLTKKLGIKTHLTFTFGLPGETKETIRKTIDFALRLDPATIQFSIATPFPGTSFYEEMMAKGHIISENWTEYDGNHKSVIGLPDTTKKDLEFAIRSAYKEWAVHCSRRNTFKKLGYYQLMSKSLKVHGIFITFFKIIRFLTRYLFLYLKEKIFFKKEIENKTKENGLKIGRLILIFNGNGLVLYWDDMRLTKGEGFASLFSFQGKLSQKLFNQCWNFERVNNNELLLTRSQDGVGMDETWRLKIIDEKQIDWEIEINLKNEIEFSAKKAMLILSSRYRTWIDSWGEGRFYPMTDYRNVELRNPSTGFIGLRGRKKLKGQLPTILLELSGNNGSYLPFIKNAKSIFGARVLEAQIKNFNGHGEKYLPGAYKLFSGRIKIVEEDFSKR